MGIKSLPRIEITLYFTVWIFSIVYSSYHVYLAGKLFDHSVFGDDFSTGWNGYKKDVVDYEWTTWLPFMIYVLSPWIVAHLILTEVTRRINPQGIPAVHCLITLSFLCSNFNCGCAVFALFQVIVYYLILRLKSVSLFWIFGILLLLLSCFVLQEVWEHSKRDEQQLTMMVVSTTWLHLHCTSFSLDLLASSSTPKLRDLYDLLGYSFYFPTYFLGPFIIYNDFEPYVYKPFVRWTKKRTQTFLFNMLRYLFWAAVTEGSLYFLYIHALQYHMSVVVSLGDWTLYGLGFLLGQFFCLKYIVVYGLAGTVANFDGYAAPAPPKCVARIHLYTDMWRVFDIGFYKFIHKYIYTPLSRDGRKLTHRLMSSAVCFCFVFIWHGVHLSIFIWSFLNFLGVTVVSFGSHISKTSSFKNWEEQHLSERNSRRLTALVSAPMFIMGPVSSFYFFSGISVGNVFMSQLLFYGTWTSVISLLFVSYCMCQVSIEMKNWEYSFSSKKIKTN